MQNIDKVILTPDQEELISHLDDFLRDKRCYFGVYGPAGSGKSFTISDFVNKYGLYDKVILSGTTNNACRVLEQSLDKHNNITIYSFIKNINVFVSELIVNISLLENYIISNNKDDIILYFNNLKYFVFSLKEKAFTVLKKNNDEENIEDEGNEETEETEELFENKQRMSDGNKTLKCFTSDNVKEIKNEIQLFILNKCPENIIDKLYIKHINNLLENLFYKNRYIRTIHSLLNFEQSRDDNHKIVFLPGKSNIEEIKTKNGVKYEFTPKLTGKRKNSYDNMSSDEKDDFNKHYYEKCFEKLNNSELLIIDESSMMKEIEFRYIIYICKILKLKVIFLGDKYQLPPVEDERSLDGSLDTERILDVNLKSSVEYSPAVKLKSSYTLSTIKRTSNPVLQEVYKMFRDSVEKASQGKVKIHNIQYTKNIQPTEKYLIKNNSEIQNVIDYVKLSDSKLENTRILCFSNKEVNRMNNIMRQHLYGDINEQYVINETLLITNYMILPKFNTKQLLLIESSLENNNKSHFNYIYNKLTENNINTVVTKNRIEFAHLAEAFKEINNKDNKLKLYTSCVIKIIKIVETQVYVKEKILNISVVFVNYENNISLFFIFNKKENEYINNLLKTEKQLIKLNTDLFRLHKCNDKCDGKIKKHICLECVNPDMCIHHVQVCEKDSCTLVCNGCYECNSDCFECVKKHRNNYSTLLWNQYVHKEYLLQPCVNYSYATTVHKSQGQSIDNIIVCEYNVANCILYNKEVSEYQKMLIYPTCMYTAVTRAKNILVRLK